MCCAIPYSAAPNKIDASEPHNAICDNQFNNCCNNPAPGIPNDVGLTETAENRVEKLVIDTSLVETPFVTNQ